ncbi:carbohydrate kinase [Caldicellulosiruptoraceae bacterium PP1]
MFDVVTIGETLIDFLNIKDNLFEANPGGAPANVAVAVSKLGKRTAMISKVGNDIFGNMIINALKDAGVYTNGIVKTDEFFTTLAFVSLNSQGERSFSFARKNSADVMLSKDEIDVDIIRNSKILHFGSLSFTHSSSYEATYFALDYAKKNNITISYDPNFRPLLWEDKELAKREMIKPIELGFVDILKISDNEVYLYENSFENFIQKYKDKVKIIFITQGKEGVTLYYKGNIKHLPTFNVDVVDTTGCGDSFMGVLLSFLCSEDFNNLDLKKVIEIATFANAAGALCATKKGAIPAIPTKNEIEEFLKNNSN